MRVKFYIIKEIISKAVLHEMREISWVYLPVHTWLQADVAVIKVAACYNKKAGYAKTTDFHMLWSVVNVKLTLKVTKCVPPASDDDLAFIWSGERQIAEIEVKKIDLRRSAVASTAPQSGASKARIAVTHWFRSSEGALSNRKWARLPRPTDFRYILFRIRKTSVYETRTAGAQWSNASPSNAKVPESIMVVGE
ncbi:hypothetical protein EVAR_47902_1 [Eumeta japonica]|uniref:Uncharacterized protein n=1 Tax=Eumeta variegata TaxID=151549 RepID=A0A4C1Y7P7_EUMVA|nr:hypothetical protein EVAR_47902_1 [Eumeta japonica]